MLPLASAAFGWAVVAFAIGCVTWGTVMGMRPIAFLPVVVPPLYWLVFNDLPAEEDTGSGDNLRGMHIYATIFTTLIAAGLVGFGTVLRGLVTWARDLKG